jgi:hypothetical protein
MAAMWICEFRRLGVDVPGVLVPSADIEGVAAGGTTTPLVAALDLRISLICGVSTRGEFTGGVSMGAFS